MTRLRLQFGALCWLLLLFAFLPLNLLALAQPQADKFREQAKTRYQSLRQAFEKKPNDFEIAWRLAKAIFNWADYSSNDQEREALALEGIAAARKAISLQQDKAAGHHYLAMNMGQLARTKMLGALPLVKEMERHLKKAIELEPTFQYAGPDRSLGLLYLEAPGWPTSIGSRSKARHHLQKAIQLVPDHPDNHLSYLEALVRWRDRKELEKALDAYRKILPQAQTKYSGDEWEQDWLEWNKRFEQIQSDYNRLQ